MVLLKKLITELENKIPDISNLATRTALTTVENKIPGISNLVKKTDYDKKITEIEKKLNNHNHDKYIDTSKFNTLATNLFNTRTAQTNLIQKRILMLNYLALIEKLLQIRQDFLLMVMI